MRLILEHVLKCSDKKIDFLLFIGADSRDERSFEYLKAKAGMQINNG